MSIPVYSHDPTGNPTQQRPNDVIADINRRLIILERNGGSGLEARVTELERLVALLVPYVNSLNADPGPIS